VNCQTSNQDSKPSIDDLLTPSLQEHVRSASATQKQPWRLRSQLWIAFFGGVLPYTLIAYLNGQRLSLPISRLRLVVIIGVVGFVATVAATYLITIAQVLPAETRTTSTARLASRAVALLAFLIVYQLQKSADRIYHFIGGGEYASLWKPGLIATIGLGFLQNIVVAGVVSLLS
jgi:hypothetical protein